MYSLSLMALAPVAAHAAQSTQWPAFSLRANVTQKYDSASPQDPRELWHNAPLSKLGVSGSGSPVFDDPDCSYVEQVAFSASAPATQPDLFYLNATSNNPYAPSRLLFDYYNVQIAQDSQRDSNGRRPVVISRCGTGSSSLYISGSEPYHLFYDNKEADEEFGSFYACSIGSLYGDGIFYRSAGEETPEGCGDVTFYPECMPLEYKLHNQQGNQTVEVDYSEPGAYNATCYVNTEDVLGEPYKDLSQWFGFSRTQVFEIGHVSVDETPAGY